MSATRIGGGLMTIAVLCAGLLGCDVRAHDGAKHGAHTTEVVLDSGAVQKLVGPRAVGALLQSEIQRGHSDSPALRKGITRRLLTNALFAREARALNMHRTSEVHDEIEVVTNQILARAYEAHLRRQVKPTEAELRVRYQIDLADRVKGLPNSTVPPYEDVKNALIVAMQQERLERKLRALEGSAGIRPFTELAPQRLNEMPSRREIPKAAADYAQKR